MVTTLVRSASSGTMAIWNILVKDSRMDICLAKLEHASLKKCWCFVGRVPDYVPPCFYRSQKLRYPLAIGGVSRDGRVTTKIATGSLRHPVGILSADSPLRKWSESLARQEQSSKGHQNHLPYCRLWSAERLAYLGWSLSRETVWGQKVRDVFPRQESDPEAKGRRKPECATSFTRECRKALVNLLGLVTFFGLEELYLKLVVGFASDPLVERQVRASWTTPSSRSPDSLLGMRCRLPTEYSKGVWQICPIASAAAVARKKQLCMPSTTASEFARFGVTSLGRRHASIPNSSCSTTLVTSWTLLTSVSMLKACGVSHDPSCG